MAQPQGEFHQEVLKNAPKDALGIIVFSNEVIPRVGQTEETINIITDKFENGMEFYARLFMSDALEDTKYGYPSRIYAKFVQNGKQVGLVSFADSSLPDGEWSSWIYYMHNDFNDILNNLPEGNNEVRLEVWSSSQIEVETLLEDDNGNQTMLTEKDSKGLYLAYGTFFYQK